MKKIKDFFVRLFSKLRKMENKGVAVLLGVQMALCLTAVIVAIVVAASVPTGTPPDGSDIADGSALPDALSFCYVTFDTDGGDNVAKQRVWIGDVPIEPKTPKKDGYDFACWTMNGEPYDFTEAITADATLVASWREMLQCVFEYGDGVDSVTVKCSVGDTISAPKQTPVRDGAYFIGWCVGDELWSFDTPVTESMTLTPSYSTTAEIVFSSDVSPFIETAVTLNGKEYSVGALKPVYSSLSERFDIVFKPYASDSDEQVELIIGNTDDLCDGVTEAGELLNFRDYLDKMPNLSAYLEKNPTVYLSLFATSKDKSVYAIPLPELYSVPSALPMFNEDIIKTLLDGDEPFVSTDTTVLSNIKCSQSIALDKEIKVPVLSGDEITYFTKQTMLHGNILGRIEYMLGDPETSGRVSGEMVVRELRGYIDVMYGDVLEKRSDLFLGEGAMYDSDELVALLRCVMLNRETLGLGNAGSAITVSSYDELLILTEMLFGARGISADSAHLYFDMDGTLIDSRINENSYDAVKKMRALILEGLVTVTDDDEAYRDAVLTLYMTGADDKRSTDEDFVVALPPLAYYADFEIVTRYLYTDMYSGQAISAHASVGDDSVKLNAILATVDYLYSKDGMALINLGGGEFCDGELATELARSLADSLVGGDYCAFLEDYLGAVSGEGSYISFGDMHARMLLTVQKYLSLGMIDRPSTLWEDDYLYSYAPSRISLTDYNERKLEELTEITSSGGEFSFENADNAFVGVLKGDVIDSAERVEYFWDEIGGREYITILRRAVGNLKSYYSVYLYS